MCVLLLADAGECFDAIWTSQQTTEDRTKVPRKHAPTPVVRAAPLASSAAAAGSLEAGFRLAAGRAPSEAAARKWMMQEEGLVSRQARIMT